MATTLKDRVAALPTELYKNIFELTFTTDGHIHTIEKMYKPPSCLQVSRSTRAAFAKSYYGLGVGGKGDTDVTVFYINRGDCAAWLKSLTQKHVDMLEEVRYRDYGINLWSGSSEENLKVAYEKHGWEFYDVLADEIGPSPTLDPAQLCVPCADCTKATNWEDMMRGIDVAFIGTEDKYRSMVDLANGMWSSLAKDDVPDFDKKDDAKV